MLGLVRFVRLCNLVCFLLFLGWWSEENFVHICSKRFTDRTEKEIEVKVYSNQKSVTLYADGKKLAEQTGEHIFKFRVPLHGKVELKAVAGDYIDTACFRSGAAPNPASPWNKLPLTLENGCATAAIKKPAAIADTHKKRRTT